MANRKRGQRAGAGLTDFVNPRFVKALGHMVRQYSLMHAVRHEISPKEISDLLGEEVSNVSYHFTVLRDECDLIEETRQERRRGSIEHYYRATVKTLLPAKAFRGLERGLRTAVAACMADDLLDDLARALEAGKLGGKDDHVTRVPLNLDQEGERNVSAIAQRAKQEAEDEQQKAADRMAAGDAGAAGAAGDGGDGTGYVFGVFAFEVAWDAPNVDEPSEGTEGEE